MGQKYEVTGHSGITETIEAASAIEANRQFIEHHAEPARTTRRVD